MPVTSNLLSQVLSSNDIEKLSQDGVKKLETHLENINKESEDLRSRNDQLVADLEKKIATASSNGSKLEEQLAAATQEVADLTKKLECNQDIINGLQVTIKRLEGELEESQTEKNEVSDKYVELQKAIDKKDQAIEQLQSDIQTLSDRLVSTTNARCEALTKLEEIRDLEVTLQHKEQRMEQERQLLNQRIQSLTEDDQNHRTEILNLRREHSVQLMTLQSELGEVTDELNNAQETVLALKQESNEQCAKIEDLLGRLKEARDKEAQLGEYYRAELQAQARLAELYKAASDDSSEKAKELTNAVEELRRAYRNTAENCSKLESNLRESEMNHEKAMEEKATSIAHLKEELEYANKLLESTKRDISQGALENISPSAAAASKLLKSGMTLTQMYSQYAQMSEELLLEKQENQRINMYLNTIMKEIESRAPLLKKQHEEYETAVKTNFTLGKQIDEMMTECEQCRHEVSEARKTVGHLSRECERLKEENQDLGRQVQVLVKEVESTRAGNQAPDEEQPQEETTSAQVIRNRLVTFRNIEELQKRNQELLAVVRELSEKQEQAEAAAAGGSLEEIREKLRVSLEDLEAKNVELNTLKELTTSQERQKTMYRSLYEQLLHDGDKGTTSSPVVLSSSRQMPLDKSEEMMKLKFELNEAQRELRFMKEDYDSYKQEKRANTKILEDQLERMRDDVNKLRTQNTQLLSRVEFSEERFKILQSNANSFKKQISALEERNKNNSITIAKHEQTIMNLKDEMLVAQKKLSEAEVKVDNLTLERQLLQESQARLMGEREALLKERKSQAIVLENLEAIKNSLEKSESEGRMRLEIRVDDLQRECAAMRRRLQEEQDKFRSSSERLQRELEQTKRLYVEEKVCHENVSTLLKEAKEELEKCKTELDDARVKLEKKSSGELLLEKLTGKQDDMNQVKELQFKLEESKAHVKSLENQLSAAKQHARQYSVMTGDIERQLKEVNEASKTYQDETDRKMKTLKEAKEKLEEQCKTLEGESARYREETDKVMADLQRNLSEAREELKNIQEQLSETKRNAATAQTDLVEAMDRMRAAEDKYAHEVVLHSTDIQALSSIKEELSKRADELAQLQLSRENAESALSSGKAHWEDREKAYSNEIDEQKQQLKDLTEQNSLLHEQLESLSSRVASLESSHLAPSAAPEEEAKTSEQLMQIIKYLRQEKNIALSKFDIIQAENVRLTANQEFMKKQVEDAKKCLEVEREKSEVSALTTAKHSELLRKIETLNAITDSNRVLREERDKFCTETYELRARVEKLEEELGPLQEKNRDLALKVDSLSSDNQLLRAEATRWRNRANVLVERANRLSPEDYKKLQQERDNLQKQLTVERETIQRIQEENRRLRQAREHAEQQIGIQADSIRRHQEEIQKLQQQINKMQSDLTNANNLVQKRNEDVAKLTEELGAKEVILTDVRNKEVQIRKIARKYKIQYEEMKALEDEKKKSEEKMETASAMAAEMAAEGQEQVREESRKELEQKLQEAEAKHTDKMKELSNQVTTSREEAENLQKENENLKKECESNRKEIDSLKSSSAEKEERSKQILRNARQKIMQLQQSKGSLVQELEDTKRRVEALEQNREEGNVRLAALKSQFEGKISRLEKENSEVLEIRQERDRLVREIESLTQRLNLLQRHVDKQQGLKPSSSSGPVEKLGIEPPTANIKPMAGPSSTSAKQQQVQPSATVAPARPPCASIRPMSLQTRMAAVLPTSQSSSSSQSTTTQIQPMQSSQVMHQPEQQPVSSPLSDCVPASSTSAVRQVAVQPTLAIAPTVGTSQTVMREEQRPGREDEPPSVTVTPVSLDSTSREASQMMVDTHGTISESQEPIAEPQQGQAVALVSPRLGSQQQVVADIQTPIPTASSSSMQTGPSSSSASSAHKRQRDPEPETSSHMEETGDISPKVKRTRVVEEEFETSAENMREEAEVQEPTSSQHVQDEDVVIVELDDEEVELNEADDQEYEEEAEDYGEYEEQEDLPSVEPDATMEGDDSKILDEVSSQSVADTSTPDVQAVLEPQQADNSQSASEAVSVATGRAVGHAARQERFPAALSQQQLMPIVNLPQQFDDTGDDSIVPSTPTLFVPRRTDSFGETVSSPHVPSGRFVFSASSDVPLASATQAELAQVASQGMDDTKMDLSQLEESGTGRSVPSTPLQVSPQGDSAPAELPSEVSQSVTSQSGAGSSHSRAEGDQAEANVPTSTNKDAIPSIMITDAEEPEDEEVPERKESEMESPRKQSEQAAEQELLEETGEAEEFAADSSQHSEESKDVAQVEDIEDKPEEPKKPIARGSGTARRSFPRSFASRRVGSRPTPIVWNEPGSSGTPGTERGSAVRGQSVAPHRGSTEGARGVFRGRRMRGKGMFSRF